MARRDKSLLRLDAVRVEGALIQPDVLASAASGAAEDQAPASYGIDRGLNLRDEIGRAYLIAKGLWATFQEGRGGTNPDAVNAALANGVLTKVLGFEFPHRRRFTSKAGGGLDLLQTAGRVPVAIAGTEGIDHDEIIATAGADSIRRSATTLVQGELNSREGALWGIATNGLTWRILRDNESITRPGYIEIDLARIFRDDLYSDFSAFWLIAHHSRFPQVDAAGSDCVLERWLQLGREQGVTVRDDLRNGVQKALFHFGRGFLENPANKSLVDRLNADGDQPLTKEEFFRQLLRLVYRLIFVMTAEDREILHAGGADETGKIAYANGYATGRLRERSRNRLSWDRHHDGFEGMKAVFCSLSHGEAKLALPALGGLFGPDQTPDLDGAQLTNKRFLKGLYNIAWLRRDGALSRINWRDMETEEFGSVYESLLELTPVVSDGGRKFSFLGEPDEDEDEDNGKARNAGDRPQGGTKGNQRKTTGSYYTPDSLVQLLLKESLDPVIDRKVAENPGNPEALLTLKVIDPACGSGHFILGAARKIAKRLADLRHGGNPTEIEKHRALRDVARHCIHGVDRNPMAIELCKVAIWIETVEPGKPLTFMDQKICCGDSLVGVYDFAALSKGIPDEAYSTLSGDVAAAANHYKKLNRLQRDGKKKDENQRRLAIIEPPADLVEQARTIDLMPEDDLGEIDKKRQTFEAWRKSGWKDRKLACDLWTAAFFVPKVDVPVSPGLCEVPLTDHVWLAWSGSLPPEPTAKTTEKIAKQAAFLHWPIVFADVMSEGGFDCVVGNPPWERVKLQEQEFFASREPEIAGAPNAAARGRLIQGLKAAELGTRERALYDEFETAKRLAEASSAFARTSEGGGGRFPLTGCGDVNTYALFGDLFATLVGKRGRAGVIVPTGIATDATTAPFFGSLIERRRLATLIDFENRNGIFPAVHRSFKFCLLTIGHDIKLANFVFFLTDPTQLNQPDRRFTLSPDEIARINPNTKTAPVFRSQADAELTAKIYAHVPVLIDDANAEGGNPSRVSVHTRIWHMAEDSQWFKTSSQLRAVGYQIERSERVIRSRALLPEETIERGEQPSYLSHISSNEPSFASGRASERYVSLYEAKMIHQFDHRWATYDATGLTSRDVTLAEKADPSFEATPRYWVPEREVLLRLSRLPKWVLDALRSGDGETITLFVAHLLFAARLSEAGYPERSREKWDIFEEWKTLAAHHGGLRHIAPTRLGIVGDNPALQEPTNANCLPSAPIDRIVTTAREKTAWYEVDAEALKTTIATVCGYRWRFEPVRALVAPADVLAFAEVLLEASCPRWLIGWRDIARSTDERTVIFVCIPRTAVGHTCPLMFVDAKPKQGAALLANLDSLVLDFVARLKIGGTHLTYGHLKQFPILPTTSYTPADLAFIVPRVLELTYTSHALASFARDLGYDGPPFGWDEDRRALLRAELDAFYARAYGLTRDELRYILDPADVRGANYPSETFRGLKNNEMARYGEYRTRRLVLDAWDRQGNERDAA